MIKGIHISTSEMVVQKSDAPKKLSNFIKGRILQAKVLDWSPEGNAQLLINGRKISARTPMMLKPGQEVELKVIQEKDAVILKVVSPVQKMSAPRISSLINFFSKNGSITDITGSRLENVRDLLYDIALKSGETEKDFLPRLIEKSGLMWEKKVSTAFQTDKPANVMKVGLTQLLKNDLKAGILTEATDPGTVDQGTGRGQGHTESAAYRASGVSAVFLETLESFQLLNQNTSDSGRFLLPFPVFSDNTFQFGQLLIDTGGKSSSRDKEKENRLIRISFFLNMTQLGPMRADFSVLKNGINGRFLLQDADTCDYVKSTLPELENRLLTIDYQVGQIECVVAQKEDIQDSTLIESLLKADDDQVLNIVV